MIERLRRLLNDMEENIRPEHVEYVEELHLKSLRYEEVPYIPLTTIYPLDGSYELFPYNEAFYDPEKMLYNELLWSFSSNLNSIRVKDCFPMQIRSNHGIGIISSLFGAKCRIVQDSMPWVDPLEDGLDGVKRLIGQGLPELNTGLGGRVFETHQFFIDTLKQFPKCYKAIHITQPDLQGPFDIAHLLLGTDVFYAIYDEPEVVQELLELITSVYIGFRKWIGPYLTDRAGEDAVYVHGAIFGGKVLLKDDTALINLSREQYERFSQPYNLRILSEFGGSLHYCGPEREWHHDVLRHPALRSLQYGNPEMHDLNYDYSGWSESKTSIAFWGYNQDYAFLNKAKDLGIKTGMTFACKASSYQEAVDILKNHIKGKRA
ncbi:MAG: hypothetical protein ABFD25_15655 [Clostridiaceae bacterium]